MPATKGSPGVDGTTGGRGALLRAEPGVVPQKVEVGIREYHAAAGESSSTLREFTTNRPAYYHRRVLGHREPESYVREFALGSAVHALFLEGGAGLTVTTAPVRGNEFKALVATCPEVVVPVAVYDVAEEMYASLMKSGIARQLHPDCAGSAAESSWVWRDKKTGLDLKVRFDVLMRNGGVDLKTTRNSTPPSFRRRFYELRYDIQAGLYLTALRLLGMPENFYYLVVSSEPPHEVFVYQVDRHEVDFHIETTRQVMDEMARCYASKDAGVWMEPWESRNILSITPTYIGEPDGKRDDAL